MKICTNCNKTYESGKFCLECGSALQDEEKVCTNCGAKLVDGAKFCPECGTKAQATNINAENTANVCKNCGFELEEGWTACPQCGTEIVKEETQKEMTPKTEVKTDLSKSKYFDENAWEKDDFDKEDCLKCANAGDPCASYNIYKYFYEKNKNKKQGAKLLIETHSSDYVPALVELAENYMYEEKGFSASNAKIFEIIEKACKLGSAKAFKLLGDCYDNGIGVESNIDKALEMYKKSYDKNNKYASYWVANIYERKEQLDKAITWYKKSIDERDDYTAREKLGIIYYNKENYDEAFKYLFKACKENDRIFSKRFFYLGLCYLDGLGCTKNENTAFNIFKKGAEIEEKFNFALGNDCSYMIGSCYREGIGVDANMGLAKEWFEKLYEAKKDVYACKGLGLIALDRKEYQNACAYFEEACDRCIDDDGDCAAVVSYFYKNGIGVEQDDGQANYYYDLAIEQGYEPDNEENPKQSSTMSKVAKGIGIAAATVTFGVPGMLVACGISKLVDKNKK